MLSVWVFDESPEDASRQAYRVVQPLAVFEVAGGETFVNLASKDDNARWESAVQQAHQVGFAFQMHPSEVGVENEDNQS